MKVFVYHHPGPRSEAVCNALVAGLRRRGVAPTLKAASTYPGRPEGDVALFYGLRDNLRDIMRDHAARASHGKRAIFFDLGYWGRGAQGKFDGYYRMSVNAYHANSYFQNDPKPPDRFEAHGFNEGDISEPQDSDYDPAGPILIAGMGPKSAWLYHLTTLDWERAVVHDLRLLYPEHQIEFKPKPSHMGCPGILGAKSVPQKMGIEAALIGVAGLVTHHSNAALDALLDGVPIFGLEDGVAKVLSQPIEAIAKPKLPSIAERLQLLYDAAYCQWSLAEMTSGKVWDFLKREGMLPDGR